MTGQRMRRNIFATLLQNVGLWSYKLDHQDNDHENQSHDHQDNAQNFFVQAFRIDSMQKLKDMGGWT